MFTKLFQHQVKTKTVGILALTAGAIGAYISVLSFTASDGRVVSPSTGFEYHIAVISNYGFKIGLFFLILGFLLQILEKIHNTKNSIILGEIVLVTTCSLALYIWTIRLFGSFFFL